MQRHNIVFPKEDGGIEIHPMKEWLRKNPEYIPAGLEFSKKPTSHQVRSELKKAGWTIFSESPTEIRFLMPGKNAIPENIEEILGNQEDLDEVECSEAAFALEYQLRDFIAQNLKAISVNGKKLHLFVEPNTGQKGLEFSTSVGFIDILAVDENGNFYIFELKRGRSPDHAIGQLTRYMGWVKKEISGGKDIHGVIVAKDINENLRCSASVIPNVNLFEYEVEFSLKPVDLAKK